MAQHFWTTAREFIGQAAELASVAQAATFIQTGVGKLTSKIEVRLRWGTDTGALTTGNTTPAGFTLAVWRKGNLNGTERIDKLGTIVASVSSNAVVARETVVFENVFAESVYVTLESWVGGTVPLLTGSVDFRVVD